MLALNLQVAETRIMAAAAEVAKAPGKGDDGLPAEEPEERQGAAPILTHAPTVRAGAARAS